MAKRLPLLQLVNMGTMTRNKDKNMEVATEMTVGDDPTRSTTVVVAVGWMHICCNLIFPGTSVTLSVDPVLDVAGRYKDTKIQRKRGP